MSNTSRKRGTPRILVTEVQVPHVARMTDPTEQAAESIYTNSISRAQIKGGSPTPLSTSRTTDHFQSTHFKRSREAPSSWNPAFVDFLERLCSPHPFGVESLGIWHDEVEQLAVPELLTREQWQEAEGFVGYLGEQLAANNPLTGNLNWAMFHFVAGMRALKTVDFLTEVDLALRNLLVILHVALCGILAFENSRVARILADRPIPSGAVDLIEDKVRSIEGGEVRAHAFQQTRADTSAQRQQLLQCVVLGISRLDVRRSTVTHGFYQQLVLVLISVMAPQVRGTMAEAHLSVLAGDLVENIGPSRAFNAASSQAEEIVHALLLNAIDVHSQPAMSQGLMQSAYAFLFTRHSGAHIRRFEQNSLLLLLLLVSQPETQFSNPYLAALANLRDVPEGAPFVDTRVPFRKLFGRLVRETNAIEWSTLLHILLTRNEAFCTYVLARTDTDTLVEPLLKYVGLATALPLPASSTSAVAQTKPSPGSKLAAIVPESEARAKETTSSSSENSVGARLWQSALLPYALSLDTVPYIHLYLWMDTILVLSSDTQFVEQLQRTLVEFWPATPQPMHKQPLSLCIAAEMMRVFQLNIMLLRDSYIHDLSLGILVNILNSSTLISTAISQKLLKLFEMILKRYSKLIGSPHPSASEQAELSVYSNTLSAFLSLFYRLSYSNNPHFIYCLLQSRQVLSTFRHSASDSVMARASQTAAALRVRIAYFHARVAVLANPQEQDILQMVGSVIASEPRTSSCRVDFTSSLADPPRWSAFMLQLTWELTLTSPLTIVYETNSRLLKDFAHI
ncbi:hypothetical protein LPJ78_000407 [Coemansia sp. RSA 989]|nr:Dyggve-Melchior-Clausen syndrome protein-domain-containing protein [Coemansia mojavensis]KAJ1744298.1 hypothetical protein LPJ68_000194 [Coemansia sp. RSA 1086]KAJ1753279.1 hypothetical protein LPJ79_000558 [Coemansia sp. RSA 1821]KAJ1868107.1 hypothetical protein LPJ78_000407 [Coemansia sp. RSA 989]KAJ2676345.1 hypothetical protein IWW42_000634 [Coemansia sp. RSA 1085]